MRTFKQHMDTIKQAMNTAYSATKSAEIVAATNISANTIAGLFYIDALKGKIDVAAGDDAWMPDNYAGILLVRDSNGNRIYERGEAAVGMDEEMDRFYTEKVWAAPSDAGLPFKSTGSISAGGSRLTCADLLTLSATEVVPGLTVRIVNATYGEFYYEIDSINDDDTFQLKGVHPFAEADTEVSILREVSTRLKFVDYSENEVSSGTFTVYYWRYPNPLTQNTDIIPFAYPDYLELMTIRRMPETKDRRPVSKRELDEARDLAKHREPKGMPPSVPKSQQGSPFKMGSMAEGTYLVRGA